MTKNTYHHILLKVKVRALYAVGLHYSPNKVSHQIGFFLKLTLAQPLYPHFNSTVEEVKSAHFL